MIKFVADLIYKQEENASKHINVLTHYTKDALLDKSGKLIKIFKLFSILQLFCFRHSFSKWGDTC